MSSKDIEWYKRDTPSPSRSASSKPSSSSTSVRALDNHRNLLHILHNAFVNDDDTAIMVNLSGASLADRLSQSPHLSDDEMFSDSLPVVEGLPEEEEDEDEDEDEEVSDVETPSILPYRLGEQGSLGKLSLPKGRQGQRRLKRPESTRLLRRR